MKHDLNNMIKNARLEEVNQSIEAQSMNHWIEDLLHLHSDSIKCGKYQSVFLSKNLEGKDMLIGAAGRLIGMRVLVSKSEIQGELYYNNEPVFITTESSKEGFQSIPFKKVFALCNKLSDKFKEMVAPEFYCVPLVGGVKSIILSDKPQEIINYYLPEIELYGTEDKFSLFTADYISQKINLPVEPPKESYSSCNISSKVEYPGKEEYLVRMAKVLEKLKSEYVQKVVIARKCVITATEAFDKLDYTAYLIDRFFQEYFYLFRQGGDEYWAGISPEIIMKQQGTLAVTEPLAGTRKKYDDEAINEKLRKELTTTAKDLTEHEHALTFMFDQLENADVGKVNIGYQKAVLETPYAFHIKSNISIQLKDNVTYFDLIGAIYPPATIWGIPVDRTEGIIAESEPFHREYYTGVYGYWNFEGDANTALIIRSAKIEENTISIYAGGGIVNGSDPSDEYDETLNKMSPLMGYFVED